MRRALVAATLGAALAPAAATAATQQVLLPGPTPYPSVSPPLVTSAPTTATSLTFRVHATSDQRVVAGVDGAGRLVRVRALQNLRLTGTGDYLIVVPAPVLDVRAGPGSQSQPGQRQGQIVWAGFSTRGRLLSADATLRPAPVVPFLPLRVAGRRDGDRYTLTLTNATGTSVVAFAGTGSRAELASLLDQTRRESLARQRLSPAYATISGPVSQRRQRARIFAPLQVRGQLRFPGRSVRFSFVLGDEQPLTRAVTVSGVRGAPRLQLVVRPTNVVRGLRPPGGGSWRSARLGADELLRRLIDTRLELVRSDQYQGFLSNPDQLGRNSTVYVYETASARRAAPVAASSSGGSDLLLVVLAVGGAVVLAGAAVVAWAHS